MEMRIPMLVPQDVLTAPGPLHTDTDAIAATVDSALLEHFLPMRDELLCVACGYPRCACGKCSAIAKGKRGKAQHTCWLEGRGVGKRSKANIAEDEAPSRMNTCLCAHTCRLVLLLKVQF